MSSPVTIIKYPFSLGAALNRSFSAPDIVHKAGHDLFDPSVAWQDLPAFTKAPSARRYKGLRNYAAVKEAIMLLGNEAARVQWAGGKSLALGGDHTQGIATVKASALVSVVRAIFNGDIGCRSKTATEALQALGDDGRFEVLGAALSGYVHDGVIAKRALQRFIDDIAVVWIDSHPDYNDRHSSGSGNIHGMALAACAGKDIGGIEDVFGGDVIRLNPRNFYVMCARDIDARERAAMDGDGVHYEDWRMSEPGHLRSVSDARNPKTLKKALDKVMREVKGKRVIVSVDVDAIHAGLHKSPYGMESVAATGTPMGLYVDDVENVLRQSAHAEPESFIRLNRYDESPAGPSAGDVFEALQGVMGRTNVIAADLSELSPAAGEAGHPVSEKRRGMTVQTSMKVLAAMLGHDLGDFAAALKSKRPLIGKLVKAVVDAERGA